MLLVRVGPFYGGADPGPTRRARASAPRPRLTDARRIALIGSGGGSATRTCAGGPDGLGLESDGRGVLMSLETDDRDQEGRKNWGPPELPLGNESDAQRLSKREKTGRGGGIESPHPR